MLVLVAKENVLVLVAMMVFVLGSKARQTMNKYTVYKRIKAEIARTAKTVEEYERRVNALARKLKI